MVEDDGGMHQPVRTVIDDHYMYLRGVRAVLETFVDQVQVVGEAASADDAVQIVRERAPDVALLDLGCPGALAHRSSRSWPTASARSRRSRASCRARACWC